MPAPTQSPSWCLVRLDDNGNEFVVRTDLSRTAAETLAHEFEGRGHKQSYWVRQQPAGRKGPR